MAGKTHFKRFMNPDYLGAYALQPGEEKILTIKSVGEETVKNAQGSEQCLVIHFEEKELPMITNSTNCKSITKIYGSPYIEDWIGKKIQIYAKKVQAFGETVEALRIREKIPTEDVIKCADCGKTIKGAAGKTAKELAAIALRNCGRELCLDCMRRVKEEQGNA